jgi:glycosyltransferase domain-containing protein
MIGDSSNHEEFDKTNHVVSEINGRLNVEHFHYPDLTNYAVTYKLIQNVSTPYSAFMPDDDFLVPVSIEKLIVFMEEHPDYSCAWGKTILFTLQEHGAYGLIRSLGPNNQATNFSIEGNSAEGRLFAHINNYTSVFIGVCRTKMFENALRNSMKMNDTGNMSDDTWLTAQQFGERVTSYSLVIQGKIKSLDCLYWVRQDHDQRYAFKDVIDSLTSSNWLSCYKIAALQIKEDIIEKDGIDEESAYNLVKYAFRTILGKAFRSEYNRRPRSGQDGILGRVKGAAKRVPCISGAYSILQSAFNISNHLSLPALLSKRSPYHDDFAPVYRAITAPPRKNKELSA